MNDNNTKTMEVDDSDSNGTTQNSSIEEEENVEMVNNDMNNDILKNTVDMSSFRVTFQVFIALALSKL